MPTLLENIPEELRQLNRWVCANADSKRPMRCFEMKSASVSKPSTWGSFQEAVEAVESGIYDYAGFVFDSDGFVGIDIDHAFGDDGMPADDVLEAMMACASYTELSKSGKGFHIICRGELPFRGRANGEGWEIYREARYFLLTGRTVMFSTIAEAQDGINLVLNKHFAGTKSVSETTERRERIWVPKWQLDESSGRMSVSYPTVRSGNRHLALVSYCGQLHSCGAHRDTVFKAGMRANERYLEPPLGANEVRQIAQSVSKYKR